MSMPHQRIWAVVPVKPLHLAKSRLAVVLDAEERARLSVAMLRDVLEALAAVGSMARTLVVTSDPAVEALARLSGAAVLEDARNAGVNDAVGQGIAFLARSGNAPGLLVLPGDIPFVDAHELRAVCSVWAGSGAAIVPATRDGGTNAFAFASRGLLRPCFGAGSFLRHVAAAAEAGVTASVLRLPGIGHDVDVPGDLDFRGQRPDAARWTRACLAGFSNQAIQQRASRVQKAFP